MSDVDAATIRHADRSAKITHADRAAAVSHTVADQSAEGPLLDHLQLFADYENWSAGDPLPNRYPDNSGITSLADNNTVGQNTSSPLVGSKSGRYDDVNTEYHSKTSSSLQLGKDLYASCWVQQLTQQNQFVIGTFDGSGAGWAVQYSRTNDLGDSITALSVDGTAKFQIIKHQLSSPKAIHFIEMIERQGSLELKIDGSSINTISYTGTTAAGKFRIGVRPDNNLVLDAVLDNVAIERADSGELQWPSSSTDRYQAGGFSWNEIKTYQP